MSSRYDFSGYFSSQNGSIYCEDLSVSRLVREYENSLKNGDQVTPMFVYSKAQIVKNIRSYTTALETTGLPYLLGYAMKANGNPAILDLVKSENCGITTVSGNEMKAALDAGIPAGKIIFNGNGKQFWEIELAISHGCLVNVDSLFDVRHVIQIAEALQKQCDVMLRLNPNIDTHVHPYLATGLGNSKFGIDDYQVPEVLNLIKSTDHVTVVGLHCHLGSTIETVQVFSECVDVMLELISQVQSLGVNTIKYLNIGGGLGINYKQHEHRSKESSVVEFQPSDVDMFIQRVEAEMSPLTCEMLRFLELMTYYQNNRCFETSSTEMSKMATMLLENNPNLLRKFNSIVNGASGKFVVATPDQLVNCLASKLKDSGLTVVLEPGRSITANTAIILSKVIGVKNNYEKNYIVVDAAMTELIRPSLYSAYHHIEVNDPIDKDATVVYDVVGPVCECADFLGQSRVLPVPNEGALIVVFDAGAYTTSMASNYNMRGHPVEVMVDGDCWAVTRQPDTYKTLTEKYIL